MTADTSLAATELARLHIPADAARLARPLTLRDGREVTVRPIRPDDSERIRSLHARLSVDAIVFRFFRPVPELSDEMVEHLTRVDYENRMALVATTGEGVEEQVVGVVRYERIGAETAEVAFVVEDAWQGVGISTTLLYMLANYARPRGFTKFVAITMGSNIRMLDVLRHCGYPFTRKFIDGEVEVALDITQQPRPAYATNPA